MPNNIVLENEVLDYQEALVAMSNNVLPLVIILNNNQRKTLERYKEKIDSLLTPHNFMGSLEILAALYSGKRYGDNDQYASISFEELYRLISSNKISIGFLKNGEETKFIEDLTNESIVVTSDGEQRSYSLNALVLESINNYTNNNYNKEKCAIKDNQEKDLENKVVTLKGLFELIDTNLLPTVVKVTLDEWLLVVDQDDTNYPLSFLKHFYHLYDQVLDVKNYEEVTYYLGINPFKLKDEYPTLRYLINGNKTYKINAINIPEKHNGKVTINSQDGDLKLNSLFNQAIKNDKTKEKIMAKTN